MSDNFDRLVSIMAKLRSPDGCPWDREQTHHSILSCLLEESYEFIEATHTDDTPAMREELGDILLQIVFHAQMAAEKNTYSIDDVIDGICEKLIRRHPHVFGDAEAHTAEQVVVNWDKIKRDEKKEKNLHSIVDDIPSVLPALLKAEKIQRRVSRVGFDWNELKPVLDKVEEEFHEFRESLEQNDPGKSQKELGDILFALVNVGRHTGICAEEALVITIDKFKKRFQYIERRLTDQNKSFNQTNLEEMDRFWEESKKLIP